MKRYRRLRAATTSFLVAVAAILAVAVRSTGSTSGEESSEAIHRQFLDWEAGIWNAHIVLHDPAGNGARTYRGLQTDRLGACGLWLITDLSMVAGADGAAPPPYEGHGVLGFDPEKRKLVGVWVDSKTHWLGLAEGTVDAEGRTLTLEVESRAPGSGAVYYQRFSTIKIDENTRRLEVSVPAPNGKRVTMAEIRFTRQKS